MRRLVVVAAIAIAALVGVRVATASTSPYDVPQYSRDYNYGYFGDAKDTFGDFVLQNIHYNSNTGGYDAIKPGTNTADELIAEIEARLNSTRVDPNTANNAANWDRTGAAFIIQTMIGKPLNGNGTHSRPSAADITEWEKRVRSAEARGLISWNLYKNYTGNHLNTYYMINRNDGSSSVNDAGFYLDPDPEKGNTIVFYNTNGSEAYVLRRQCGNPIGVIKPIPDDANFTITANSAVSNATPAPLDSINFTHNLVSNAPTSPTTINWRTQNMPSGTTVASGNVGTMTAGSRAVGPETYNVPNGTPAGTQICRRLAFNPANQSGGSGAGNTVCATVRKAYNLVPTAVSSALSAQDGDTITFTYKVENNGGNNSDPTTCYVRDGANNPVGVGLTCAASQVFVYNTQVTVGTENVTVTNQAPGTRICRTLYVRPATPAGITRPSTQTCVVVAKVPLVRFGGNDVWAGGGFAAVTPACNNNAKITTQGRALSGTVPTQYAGSSVEYSAFALNRVTGFGSAGRVLVGSGALGDLARGMTFANNEADATKLGYYGAAQHCINDYSSLYGSLPLGGSLAISNPTSGAWREASYPSLSGAAPAGVTKVYYSEGDVTITGNITYPGSYADVNQIPSILIVAKGNIYVSPGVSRIDAMLVTRGTLYTCWPKPVPNSVSLCNVALTVNGSVKANAVDLYRTAGSNGVTVVSRKAPAELFNFSPELYLRNVLNLTAKPSMQVMNSIELPPRY